MVLAISTVIFTCIVLAISIVRGLKSGALEYRFRKEVNHEEVA
jgi:hypothetical protein